MIKPEQIPPESWAAADQAAIEGRGVGEIIAAALNAWPGIGRKCRTVWKDGIDIEVPSALILPLSQETPNV